MWWRINFVHTVDFCRRAVYNHDIMTVRQNIGQNIRTLRKACGLTQADLGRRLGLSRSTISEIESGKRGLGVEGCIKIAEFFEVDPKRVYGSVRDVCPTCGQSTEPVDGWGNAWPQAPGDQKGTS